MTASDLRELRKSTGLSMKKAAELSGTPYRTWQDWEGGRRRVPGIAVEWLILYQATIQFTDSYFAEQCKGTATETPKGILQAGRGK